MQARHVVVQDRPEADPLIRFLAYFETSPNGVQGLGSTMTAAEEDLELMEAECMGERSEMAEHGESPWYLS